jgi:DNA repair exonuclease SbcCD nuclease subunit
MRFIHTSDWQIGMPFLFLKEDSRKAMHNARLDAIKAIAKLAKDESAEIDFVLVCGDIVDSPRISETVLRLMFREIEGIKKPVYLLAGNHEWNGTEYIFENEHFGQMLPSNVTILHEGVNQTCVNGVEIVAAPLKGKHADQDVLKTVLDQLDSSNSIRIVAGHGSLDTFIAVDSDDEKLNFAAIKESLDKKHVQYVALGDRHSATSVDSNGKLIPFKNVKDGGVLPVYYSGSNEATDYDELDSGKVLIVDIAPNREVLVEKVVVGKWNLVEASTLQKPTILRNREDIQALETYINAIENHRETAVKIYLDSELYLEDDIYRKELFRQWHDELLAGFKVSENKDMSEPRIKQDPLEFQIPSKLKGYVRETYQELRDEAVGEGSESEVAYEAFSLLTSFLGAKK